MNDIRQKIREQRDRIERKYKHGDPVLRDLFAVMTVAEASVRFNRHVNTIRAALAMGKLDVRQSGETWLITTDSLIKLYGTPEPPNLENVELALPLWSK